MAVSKRKRFEIFKRDRFTCQYCGRTPPNVVLQVDHVLPISKGGGDEATNLVTSCTDCNSGKSNVLLETRPEAITEQLELQREKLEQLQAFNRFMVKARKEAKKEVVEIAEAWRAGHCDPQDAVWDAVRDRSISVFLARMPMHKVLEAVDIALSRKRPRSTYQDDLAWRYFCGVCWKMIKEAEDG